MAISDDLRSIQLTLGEMCLPLDSAPIVRLVCSNLQSLAEQVESLENISFLTRDLVEPLPRRRCRESRSSVSF